MWGVYSLLWYTDSWRQNPTKQQLYDHQTPITKNIKVRRTRHAGHCWRNRDKFRSDVLLWTSSHDRAKAVRPARLYIKQLSVALKTYRKRWTVGRSGKRGSGISVLMAWQDDGDEMIEEFYYPLIGLCQVIRLRTNLDLILIALNV